MICLHSKNRVQSDSSTSSPPTGISVFHRFGNFAQFLFNSGCKPGMTYTARTCIKKFLISICHQADNDQFELTNTRRETINFFPFKVHNVKFVIILNPGHFQLRKLTQSFTMLMIFFNNASLDPKFITIITHWHNCQYFISNGETLQYCKTL